MKTKALRNKTTGKYLHYLVNRDEANELFPSNLPELLCESTTLEDLLEEYKNAINFSTDTSEYELVEFDLIESGVIGDDIRNKLTPFKNLVASISLFLIEKSAGKKILMKGHIEKEIKQAKISLEYLTKIL